MIVMMLMMLMTHSWWLRKAKYSATVIYCHQANYKKKSNVNDSMCLQS